MEGMKKSVLVFLFLFLFAGEVYSQSGWVQQNSVSNSRLNLIYFLNQNTGWIMGDDGTVLKTENGGLNWISKKIFSESHHLGSIFFINENTGWLSGNDNYIGVVYKTTDGGENWVNQIFDPTGFYIGSLHFININTGWIINCGNYDGWKIQNTTDGGKNWANQYVGHYRSSIYFLNQLTAWAVGHSILKTTDGGISWIDKYVTASEQFESVYFINQNIGWAVGIDFVIVKTTDGGNNWFVQKNCNFSLTSIQFIDENTGWTVGSYGILKTTNSGTDWGYQNMTNQILWSVYFMNQNTGWAVGGAGTILKTIDGGGTIDISPIHYKLYQNFPNPFNPKTTIKFELSKGSIIQIILFDVTGKEIKTIVNALFQIGVYEIQFDAINMSSGIYFYKLVADPLTSSRQVYTESKKMVLLK